jgi:hypothetical protein
MWSFEKAAREVMIDDDAWHGVEGDSSNMKAAHGLRIHIRGFIHAHLRLC